MSRTYAARFLTVKQRPADPDGDWQSQGACRNHDPDRWSPDSHSRAATEPAKVICRGCDVQQKCLEYALRHDEGYGIWGGLDADERRAMLKRKKRAGE